MRYEHDEDGTEGNYRILFFLFKEKNIQILCYFSNYLQVGDVMPHHYLIPLLIHLRKKFNFDTTCFFLTNFKVSFQSSFGYSDWCFLSIAYYCNYTGQFVIKETLFPWSGKVWKKNTIKVEVFYCKIIIEFPSATRP